MKKEENTFENPIMAEEWIQAVESEKDSSRAKEIYPFLMDWSHSLAPKLLIEIGSGQGICSAHVEVQDKYIGIEPSITLTKRAEEIYGDSNKTFMIGNVYDMPLGQGSADAVFSVGVWFHIENLDKAHKEVSRILKIDGELLIVTSNSQRHSIWESAFVNPLREGKKIDGMVVLPSGYMTRNIFYLHEESEIIESLERNGFSVKSIDKLGQSTQDIEIGGMWSVIRATKISN
jgi:SAM-dependent methyltransferase